MVSAELFLVKLYHAAPRATTAAIRAVIQPIIGILSIAAVTPAAPNCAIIGRVTDIIVPKTSNPVPRPFTIGPIVSKVPPRAVNRSPSAIRIVPRTRAALETACQPSTLVFVTVLEVTPNCFAFFSFI